MAEDRKRFVLVFGLLGVAHVVEVSLPLPELLHRQLRLLARTVHVEGNFGIILSPLYYGNLSLFSHRLNLVVLLSSRLRVDRSKPLDEIFATAPGLAVGTGHDLAKILAHLEANLTHLGAHNAGALASVRPVLLACVDRGKERAPKLLRWQFSHLVLEGRRTDFGRFGNVERVLVALGLLLASVLVHSLSHFILEVLELLGLYELTEGRDGVHVEQSHEVVSEAAHLVLSRIETVFDHPGLSLDRAPF